MSEEEHLVCNIDENKRVMWIVSQQIHCLQDLLCSVDAAYDANHVTQLFHHILQRVRSVFQCDPLFEASISIIKKRRNTIEGGLLEHRDEHALQLGAVLPELALLQGAVVAFMETHLTEKEKMHLGFLPDVEDLNGE